MITDALPADAAWFLVCAMSVAPFGYMLGATCSPCCGCPVADGKPRTDPTEEGTWVPSGTWLTGVTWTFVPNTAGTGGETWFFYGSRETSHVSGDATEEQIADWNNLCNWYSHKTTTPSSLTNLATVLSKRATRLPPDDAIVHVYSNVIPPGDLDITLKNAYIWNGFFSSFDFNGTVTLTCTGSAHDSDGGVVTATSSPDVVNGGATFTGSSYLPRGHVVNGGAAFYGTSFIENAFASPTTGIVYGDAVFYDSSENRGRVIGDATFNGSSLNDGGVFYDEGVNGNAVFNDFSQNSVFGVVREDAVFNDSTKNWNQVLGSAEFNNDSINDGEVFGNAVFNDNSIHEQYATVEGSSTFNDAACSRRTIGLFADCPGVFRRKFVTNDYSTPVCNGSAPDGCANSSDTCGCG